jgi:predicted DNA-binding transcriptional regulator YafY
MANTSSRSLRLLSLLQTKRFWPGEDLAARMQISIRTLRRDVDRLRELGYPVQAQRGVQGGYQLAPGATLPPLVLDDDEAVAIAVGLLSAAQSTVEGMGHASIQALAKLVQVLPARLRRRVDAMQAMTQSVSWGPPQPGVVPEVLTTLAQACRDQERVDFAYCSVVGILTERRTDPHRLVAVGRRWYLVAYDLDRHDWRSFRLDRLTNPRPTGTRFAPRALPAADAAEFVRAGLNRTPVDQVVARVHAPAAEVRARIGRWAMIDELSASTCRVVIQTDSFEWAALALTVAAADFVIEQPPAFLVYAQDLAVRFDRAAAG